MTIPNGTRVAIFNETISGRPVLEGYATVKRQAGAMPGHRSPVDGWYDVRFEGDGPRAIYRRYVDEKAQANPEAHLRGLIKAARFD